MQMHDNATFWGYLTVGLRSTTEPSMLEIVKYLKKAESQQHVLQILHDFFRNKGFRAFCYAVPSESGGDVQMYDYGFPAEWMVKYRNGLGMHDPVVAYGLKTNVPFAWSDVVNLKDLNELEAKFLTALKSSQLTDGLSLPTFGLNGEIGYFGLGECESAQSISDAEIGLLQLAGQVAHARLVELANNSIGAISLSNREMQILSWIAQGKSNTDIAQILQIRTPTVSTYIQRMFFKLGVNDRLSAVVKSIKIGVLSLSDMRSI